MRGRGNAIVLIGFMGTGKSSVGRALARRTGLRRFDTDEMIKRRFNLPIIEIFAQHGEQAFRDAEAEALAQMSGEPAIIVTGGGALLRAGVAAKIRRLGMVAQLAANLETLFERLSRRGTRPLLQTPDPRATIEELLRLREPLYRAAADFAVDTTRLTHEEVAEQVLSAVEKIKAHAP